MCQLLLSGIDYVPTLNVHSNVWDHLESYTIYMLIACRLKITFTFSLKLIISFLVQLQHLLLPYLIVTSSQVRVCMPLPLLSCYISGLGPEGLLHRPAIWEEAHIFLFSLLLPATIPSVLRVPFWQCLNFKKETLLFKFIFENSFQI
jgi:hypothetical protein